MSSENLALAVSVVALLVSGIAVLIAWRSFRREGALVTADLSIREPTLIRDGVLLAPDISLSVRNQGLAAIGVTNALWLIEHEDGTTVAVVQPDEGPPLPMTLAGLHTARWSFDFEKMSGRVPSGMGEARVLFILGDGREVSTAACPLPSKTDRTVEEDLD